MSMLSDVPIGDRPFHPCHSGINHQGITYRQWLIGQALTGFCSTEWGRDVSPAILSDYAIDQADAVLERL